MKDYETYINELTESIESMDEDYSTLAHAYDEEVYTNRSCACGACGKVLRECVDKNMKPRDIICKFVSLANNLYIRSFSLESEATSTRNYADILPNYMISNLEKEARVLFDYSYIFDTVAKIAEELLR